MWKPISCLVLVLCSSCASPSETLDEASDGFEPMFSGGKLEGWTVLGKADYTLVSETETGTVLTGEATNMQRNSFLVSEALFDDFELQVDVRIAAGGNSGIQIRSHVDWTANDGAGRLWGYQIEVDPSERAWSGGLYDEGRRGWLDSLEGREAARQAFVVGEWNHYRILCEGAHIRTWVNGVPCADYVDAGPDLDLSGHVAFQVHSGKSAEVAFRNPRLREL